MWIATGYGAGVYMTDAMSGIIIRETILPHFKQNPPDYGGGIEAGADAIIKQMSLSARPSAEECRAGRSRRNKQRQHSGGGALPVIFWLMIIGFVVLSHVRRAGGRRYRARASAASARGSCCGA